MDIQIVGHSSSVPFIILENGSILSYKSGRIYYMNERLEITDDPVELFSSFKYKLLSRVQILSRLLRIGVRTSIEISSECVLLQVGHSIIEFNPMKKNFSKGYLIGIQARALNISKIESIRGFDNMIVFGEYLSNPLKRNTSIFKRDGVDKWSVIYSFPDGEINHIHNIIPDIYNNCVWILTGDFDNAACIWKATDNFKEGVSIFQNDQLYRSCMAFPTPNGLLYVTDTPFAQNYVCLLYKENDEFKINKLCAISGSCINATKVLDQFVFSTVVEGDGRDETLMKLLFSRKRGAGIIDNRSHLYVGNLKNGFQDVYQVKKDLFPFAFQFGTIVFPKGKEHRYIIYASHVATKCNSSTILIKI